jgi:opacity protein-like surface antigen
MRKRFVGSVSTTAALLLLAAAPAQAQRTAVHQGFWISFGFGAGTAFGDDAFDGDSKFGGAGFLRMGGSPSQQLLIGGEMIGWGTDQDGVQIGRGALMFTALYYPSPRGGLYLKGSAGFAGRSAEWEIPVDGRTATVTEEEGGIGLGAGLGYDIQLGRNFFLTPALDFVYTGTEGDGASLLLFTLGATWH